MAPMEVVVSDEARAYAVARGGVVHVLSHEHRCCSGTITLLDTTTEASTDGANTSACRPVASPCAIGVIPRRARMS